MPSDNKPLIDSKELQRMAPEKLVSGFTQTPVMKFAAIALAAHLVIIGGTSVFYIRDMIDPEGAAARQAAIEAARDAKVLAERQERNIQEGKSVAEDGPKTDGGEGDAGEADAGDDEKSAVEKRIEEKASPDEFPDINDLLGEQE